MGGAPRVWLPTLHARCQRPLLRDPRKFRFQTVGTRKAIGTSSGVAKGFRASPHFASELNGEPFARGFSVWKERFRASFFRVYRVVVLSGVVMKEDKAFSV